MYTLRIYAYNLTHALKRGIGVSIKIPKRYFRVKHVAILGIWLFESETPRFRASHFATPFSDLDSVLLLSRWSHESLPYPLISNNSTINYIFYIRHIQYIFNHLQTCNFVCIASMIKYPHASIETILGTNLSEISY